MEIVAHLAEASPGHLNMEVNAIFAEQSRAKLICALYWVQNDF
jgi:hypothetical protein